MNPNDPRIAEYQNDLQRYQSWGNLFLGFSFGSFFSPNVPCDSLTLHNGLEYLKAKMKLNALADARHSDEEIERRLTEIDEDIRKAEDLLRHDLSFRGLLRP